MNDLAIFAFLLVLARVSAFIAVFPLFSRRQVPVSVKAGMAVALTVFWYGSGIAILPPPEPGMNVTSFGPGTVALVQEILCGAVVGLITGWVLIPARIAGAYIGQELGLTMGQMMDPTGMESGSDVTRVFETISMFLFFVLDMHHWVLLCLHYSFTMLQGASGLMAIPTGALVFAISQLDEYGLLIAAPVAICLAIVNFAVLYLNKASPSLNLFTVGAPLRLICGLFCLVLFWPMIVRNISLSFESVDRDVIGALFGN